MRTIRLEASRGRSTKQQVKGIEFMVSLSPYFFPESINPRYEQERGCLIIDFKYLDQEDGQEADTTDDLVTLYEGRHTGKLLSLHIHVDRHDLHKVSMLITDAAKTAIGRAKERKPEMFENYDLAENAIRTHSDEIAEAACST